MRCQELTSAKRLGGCEKIDAEQAIQEAVALAAKSDVVIFVGGLTPEWESEGFDRPTLDMPGLQNQTIARLAEANPNTVVVIQAVGVTSLTWCFVIDVDPEGIGRVDALGRLCFWDFAGLVLRKRGWECAFRCTLW